VRLISVALHALILLLLLAPPFLIAREIQARNEGAGGRVPLVVVAVAPAALVVPTRRENVCSTCRWRLHLRRPLRRRSSQSRCRLSRRSSLRSPSRPIP
jgi:hypothetical protein